jgi:hypothetical protein
MNNNREPGRSNVVNLRADVAPVNAAVQPVTDDIANQRQSLRELAARYRELRKARSAGDEG